MYHLPAPYLRDRIAQTSRSIPSNKAQVLSVMSFVPARHNIRGTAISEGSYHPDLGWYTLQQEPFLFPEIGCSQESFLTIPII